MLELPVTVDALKPRFHSALILDVVLQTLTRLVEAATARALVGTHQLRSRQGRGRRGVTPPGRGGRWAI